LYENSWAESEKFRYMCAVEEKSDNTILNERSQKWVSNEEEGEKVTESRKIELQRELCILLP